MEIISLIFDKFEAALFDSGPPYVQRKRNIKTQQFLELSYLTKNIILQYLVLRNV